MLSLIVEDLACSMHFDILNAQHGIRPVVYDVIKDVLLHFVQTKTLSQSFKYYISRCFEEG